MRKEKYEATLVTAYDQELQLWAAQLQTTTNRHPIKLAGRSHRDAAHPMRNDGLVTLAIVAGLSSIPAHRYEAMRADAQEAGAPLPRLLIHAHPRYAKTYRADRLQIGMQMADALRKTTAKFDVEFAPISGRGDNPTSVALGKFARRVLVHPYDDNNDIAPMYRPDAISVIEHHAPSAVPSIGVAQPAPLTPAYGY